MARRGFHRVEPVRVNRSPSEIVAVIADQPLPRRREPFSAITKGNPPPWRFHDQHDHQQENYRDLRGKHRGILRQTIIPNSSLQIVQGHEEAGPRQPNAINLVQHAPVAQAVTILDRPADQTPEKQLMRKVKAPCRSAGPKGRLWQLPVIPGRTLIRQQVDLMKQRVEQ